MFEIKYHRVSGNTTEASDRAIALLKDAGFKFAVFSTSPARNDGSAEPSDGPESNWPYFSPTIRVGDEVHVFDSTLLNAARPPRAREVSNILDVAQRLDNVHFATNGACFTTAMTPEAVSKNMAKRSLTALTPGTRGLFWQQLSAATEAEIERQRM